MNGQKQTAGTVTAIPAAAKREGFSSSIRASSISRFDAIDNGGILGILQAAAPDRVRMADLADELGMTTRQVRKEVEALRRAGIPICSSQSGYAGGYWLAGGEADMKAYQERAKKTAVNRLKLVNQMRKAAAEKQPGFWDSGGTE